MKNKKEKKDCVSKVHKCLHPLLFVHLATTSLSINFNNHFLNAQSDLFYILTPSSTPGHDQGLHLHRAEGLGLSK